MHSSLALSLFGLAVLNSQRAVAYGPPNGQYGQGQWGGQPQPAVVTTTVAAAVTTPALNILQEDAANGHVYATAPVVPPAASSLSSSSSTTTSASKLNNNFRENYVVNGQPPASSVQQASSQVQQQQQQPTTKTPAGSQPSGGTTSGSTSGSTSGNTQNTTPSGQQSGNGKTCIYWEGDFAYRMDGGFGSATGTGSSASKCWDNSISNAAIYICDSGTCSSGKYTKFEATLNTNFPTIDVSLVDGYSRPVHCTWTKDGSPVSVGGTQDLYDLNQCTTPGGDNTCKNVEGPIAPEKGGSYNAMSAFFKAGNAGSNAYCDYTICEETPNVSLPALDPNSPSTVTCVVGKTKGVNAKVKRDPAAEELAAPADIIDAEKRSEENATDFTSTLKGLARRALRSGGAHAHARSLKHAHA